MATYTMAATFTSAIPPMSDCPVQRWVLRRNCCLTPRQLALAGGVLLALQGMVGLAFSAMGYPVVTLFALVDAVAVAVALLAHARHACDRETLTLSGSRLCVEELCGAQCRAVEFDAVMVRVHAPTDDQPLVQLAERERCVVVGRYLPAHKRPLLAKELCSALQQRRAQL
ncbi:MAG TPA: DUF2244 domain-containing protein [Burkholderiaceae bacterium]|nr:DUF2244 domain-containing protein [Burkholderiaceae bacterium]